MLLSAAVAYKKSLIRVFENFTLVGNLAGRQIEYGKVFWEVPLGSWAVNAQTNAYITSNGVNIAVVDIRTWSVNVQVIFKGTVTTADTGFIVFNYVDNNNYWYLGNGTTNTTLRLFVVVAGVTTLVTTFTITAGTGANGGLGTGDTININVVDDYIYITINYSNFADYFETNRRLKTATKHGMYRYNDGVATKALEYDYFQCVASK